MSQFKFQSDKLPPSGGYLSRKQLFEYVTEAQVFGMVFGFVPEEGDYVVSPFREDNNPDCFFHTCPKGRLRFVDFGNSSVIKGIKMDNMDCIDAIQVYYKTFDFYLSLSLIKKTLLGKKGLSTQIYEKAIKTFRPTIVKSKVKIHINICDFTHSDKKFLFPYGITRANLREDKVFPITELLMTGTKKGTISVRPKGVCYVFLDFIGDKKKTYAPHDKANKWYTNCSANDIGGINLLAPMGRQLVITKSWKDFRVLKNAGLNVIWFQNEGMIPDKKTLLPILKRFTEIVVFFDSDKAGKEAAQKVVGYVNSICTKRVHAVTTPELGIKHGVVDPADYRKHRGKDKFMKLLIKLRLK